MILLSTTKRFAAKRNRVIDKKEHPAILPLNLLLRGNVFQLIDKLCTLTVLWVVLKLSKTKVSNALNWLYLKIRANDSVLVLRIFPLQFSQAYSRIRTIISIRVRSTGVLDITEMQQYQKWQHISSIIMEFKDLSNSSYTTNDILFINIYKWQSCTSPTPQTEPRNEFLMERT